MYLKKLKIFQQTETQFTKGLINCAVLVVAIINEALWLGLARYRFGLYALLMSIFI